VLLSQWHGASLGCWWRRRPLYMEDSCAESRRADKGRSSSLGIGQEDKNSSQWETSACKETLHEVSKSKNLIINGTMYPHCNIHKQTWISSDRKIKNFVHNISVDKRPHSSVVDAQSFRGTGCDTDHCVVVKKLEWDCQ